MAVQKLNDYKNRRIHFIGVGGCSMSGLAQILDNLGFTVSGTDAKDGAFLQALRKRGIDARVGHDASLVEGAGLVIRTAAIKPENPEYKRALELGLPVMERSELLGIISADYNEVIGIAGCHGKTTITSMLARIVTDTDVDATVHVGGMVDFLGGGVKLGQSDIFITEACEYVRSFMTLHPKYILINNIDDDHLDYYKDLDEIIQTFRDFTDKLPEDGVLFACADDADTMKVAESCDRRVITYSAKGPADYSLQDLVFDELGNPSFDVMEKDKRLGRIALNVPGAHNAANALAACVVAMNVFGLSLAQCADALAAYRLAGRRFEKIGEWKGVQIFHDYAHHPSEIKCSLAAAKQVPHKKLWVLFQCNSYTRAKTLKEKYALAFEDADTVLVPEIYPGRDIDKGEIHATDLVKAIDGHSHNCLFLSTFAEIRDYLHAHAQSGDMVMTLGSGDVNKQQYILLED